MAFEFGGVGELTEESMRCSDRGIISGEKSRNLFYIQRVA
jgi:hypothetical protein